MMSLASARKRAAEFAAATDGRPAPMAVIDPETRAFLDLVEQLRSIDTPRPDPQFTADLRSRLVDAARLELLESPVDRSVTDRRSSERQPRRRRAMSAAAGACIVAGSGMGVAAASQSALPGDALYPIKRGIEQVELSLAGSAAERGQEYIDFADSRLTEIQGLALTRPDDPATPALIAQALDDFTTQANDGAVHLIRAYERDSSEQSIIDLREFTDDSADKLEMLGETVPADVRDELIAAAEILTTIDQEARDACSSCSTLAPLTLPVDLIALVPDTEENHGDTISAPSIPALPIDPRLPTIPTPPVGPSTQGLGQLPTLPTTRFPTGPPNGGSSVGPQQQPSLQVPSEQLPSLQLPSQLPSQQFVPPTAAAGGPSAAPPPALQPEPSNGQALQQPPAQAPTEFTAPTQTFGPTTAVAGDQSGVSLPTVGLADPSNAVPIIIDPVNPVNPVNPTTAPVVPDLPTLLTPPLPTPPELP